MTKIYCLDNDEIYYFSTENKREAIENLLYTLTLEKSYDKNAIIKTTERCITLIYNSLTYACKK